MRVRADFSNANALRNWSEREDWRKHAFGLVSPAAPALKSLSRGKSVRDCLLPQAD